MENVLKIDVKIEDKKIKCLRMNNFNFIKTINNKLLGK